MKIGINAGGHLQAHGGGFKAVYWHARACKELGHDVTIYVRTPAAQNILTYFSGMPIRWYKPGVEKDYDVFLSVDHFNHCLPLAKRNLAHIFFPAIQAPPEGIEIYTNSAYTASHVKANWNRDAQVMYIPIENDYYVGRKDNVILHVSRFAEPSNWADKAHRQLCELMRMINPGLPGGGWRLILAGAVEQGQHGYLSALMEMYAGVPIDYITDPSDQEMRDLYAKATFYLHATGISLPMVPSAQEHLGLAPLEAQASGAVPLVFRSGGMPEVVIDHRTGLLFDDLRECGQMLIDLSHNWHIWAAMSQQGIAWAKSWQDFDAFKERVAQMLEGKPIAQLPRYLLSSWRKSSSHSAVALTRE